MVSRFVRDCESSKLIEVSTGEDVNNVT